MTHSYVWHESLIRVPRPCMTCLFCILCIRIGSCCFALLWSIFEFPQPVSPPPSPPHSFHTHLHIHSAVVGHDLFSADAVAVEDVSVIDAQGSLHPHAAAPGSCVGWHAPSRHTHMHAHAHTHIHTYTHRRIHI